MLQSEVNRNAIKGFKFPNVSILPFSYRKIVSLQHGKLILSGLRRSYIAFSRVCQSKKV